VAAIAYAGLSPFDFHPANEVDWIETGPGLRTGGDSISYAAEALEWPEDGRELTIHLWFKPAEEPRTHLARILALVDSGQLPALTVDQWGAVLIVRDRFEGSSGKMIYREHSVVDHLRVGVVHHLVITSDAQGTAAYLDGSPLELDAKPPIIARGERFGGRLVLGNSATGNQPWSGEIYGVAVFDRVFSGEVIALQSEATASGRVAALAGEPGLLVLHPFDDGSGSAARNLVLGGEPLEIPAEFQPLRKTVLSWPRLSDRRYGWYRTDLAINMAGFLPTGFLLALVLRRWGQERRWVVYASAVLLAASLSLIIELTQVFLPSRVSSFSDLLSNTLGGVLGCALESVVARVRSAGQRRVDSPPPPVGV